jgi:hypothetical protein
MASHENCDTTRARRGWTTIAWMAGSVSVLLLLLVAVEGIADIQDLSIKDQGTYWFWDLIVKAVLFIGAVGTATGAIIQMKKNRYEREQTTIQAREELTWRRAEFLLRLWKDFNADLTLRPCIKLIDVGDEHPDLAPLFTSRVAELDEHQAELRYHFDRYFDFLQSLAFCEMKQILSLDEIACFGWHYWRILQSQTLSDYCDKNGYDDVLALATQIVAFQQDARAAIQRPRH